MNLLNLHFRQARPDEVDPCSAVRLASGGSGVVLLRQSLTATVPGPAIMMTCDTIVSELLLHGLTCTSSAVRVSVKAPVTPAYAPVPEPATIGVSVVTAKWSEQVSG